MSLRRSAERNLRFCTLAEIGASPETFKWTASQMADEWPRRCVGHRRLASCKLTKLITELRFKKWHSLMWFTASALFRSAHSIATKSDPLWEEQILLIEALTENAAMHEAERVARSSEHSYKVAYPEKHDVRWIFVRIAQIYQIDSDALRSGTEIFARFLKESEAKSLLAPFDND